MSDPDGPLVERYLDRNRGGRRVRRAPLPQN
jgi:hypothetical protein